MSAGRKIVVALRAVGILVGIWGTLGLIGWLAGALPPITTETSAESTSSESMGAGDAEDDPAPPDDSPVAQDATDVAGSEPEANADEASDEASAANAESPPDPADPTEDPDPSAVPAEQALSVRGRTVGATWSTLLAARPTAATGEEAAITAASIVGDARPELVVAIGTEVHVVGLHDGRPLRVARIGDGVVAARPARPLVADVTGDGIADLVVGHARLDAQGAPTGGTLQLLAGNAAGGLDAARGLAPIAAVALAAIPDARGARVAAMHWADGFGRRPSEVWIFGGGASPTRRGRGRVGNDGADVAVITRGEGHALVAIDQAELRHLSVEGARLGSVELPEGVRVLVHDLDGDGEPEVVTLGRGLHVVRVASALEATPVDAPHGIRRLLIHDVDGDGRPDILGVTRGGVVLLRQHEPLVFVEEPLVYLPGGFRAHDAAIVDGPRPELAIVGLSLAGWQLVGVPLGLPVTVSEVSSDPMPDAPIVLTLPLR